MDILLRIINSVLQRNSNENEKRETMEYKKMIVERWKDIIDQYWNFLNGGYSGVLLVYTILTQPTE